MGGWCCVSIIESSEDQECGVRTDKNPERLVPDVQTLLAPWHSFTAVFVQRAELIA